MWLRTFGAVFVAAYFLASFHEVAFAQAQDPSCFVQSVLLKPIWETHTFPPYPVDAFHQNQQGTVLMRVDIADDGVPSDVSVMASSGFSLLDQAASNYVKTHWRWNPFHLEACSTINTRVSVKWDLAAAYSGQYGGVPSSPAAYDGAAVTRALLEDRR